MSAVPVLMIADHSVVAVSDMGTRQG
ncbi:hypothetical protein AGR1C_Cc40414 [Agrobacterium fabacearum TT111]|nr:hypothetical protein AGR1C_Cc40414 [Agrobacterium fabacearum TT111]